MIVSAREILDALGAEPDPVGGRDTARALTGVAPLDRSRPSDLSFCAASAEDEHRLRGSSAGMLIVDAPALAGLKPGLCRAVIARSENARLDFIGIVRSFFAPPAPESGIHPSAVIAAGARIGEQVAIGPLCTIAADVQVGSGSVLHPGVHLYPRVRIGSGVTINSGTIIGADGYGFERNAAGELERFPHLGGVVIEDEVEIGSNVSIDRGTLDDTWIGARARIDNLVHVAHNVRIGEDAAVIAHAMLGGSSSVGARSWIAPCVALLEGVNVGDDAVIGMGSVVTKSVPDGMAVVGSPARELDLHRTLQRRLRELTEQGGATPSPSVPKQK